MVKNKEETVERPVKGADAEDRDLSMERPATAHKLDKRRDEANHTANQTLNDGNKHEVQGKLAVPETKVMKRGSTKWTDEDGNVIKKVNDAEVNKPLAEREIPQYLKLHQEVLDGADPIEATLAYQDKKPEDTFQEAKLADAEKYPRTGGIGAGTETPENQQKTDEEKK